MADEEHELPEGVTRPGESESDKTRQMLGFLMLADTVTALEEGKLSLTMAVKALKEQLEQHKQDARDVYYYLNKKCDDSYEVIAHLEEQLLGEQGDREVAEKRYEEQLVQVQKTSELEQRQLQSTIDRQLEKLMGLDEFLDKKEEMENELAGVHATLEKERKQNQAVLKEMEMSWIIERNDLKKGYQRDLDALRQEMDDKLVGKMLEKTRDIHTRNNEIALELKHQSKQADQVLVYNQVTVDRDRQLRVDLQLAAEAEREMSKKLSMYQRMLKELNEKLSAAEDVQKRQSEAYEKLEQANIDIREENEKLVENSKSALQYRAGKVVHWSLLSLKELIGDEEYRDVVEKELLVDIQNTKIVSKKHEATLIKLVRLMISKFPDLFGGGGQAASSTAPITFFPPVSPKASNNNNSGGFTSIGGHSGSASKALSSSPRRNFRSALGGQLETVTVGTQTDEQRDPLQSDSMWITGAKPKAPSPVLTVNEEIDRLFAGGHSQWGGGSIEGTSAEFQDAQSILNNISIKSTSAIPKKPARGTGPSRKKPGNHIDGTVSLDGGKSQKYSAIKESHRKILSISGKPSKLSQRPDKHVGYFPGEGLSDADSHGRHSPQSTLSMSPRMQDDDSVGMRSMSPQYHLDEEGGL